MSKGTAWGFTSEDAPRWQKDAACQDRDPELFFPLGIETEGDLETMEAKAFCRNACDVRSECLKFALDNGIDDGVWGATTPRERRVMLGRPASKRQAARRQAVAA